MSIRKYSINLICESLANCRHILVVKQNSLKKFHPRYYSLRL